MLQTHILLDKLPVRFKS